MIDENESLNNLNLTAAEENYQKGVLFFQAGKYEEARECLTQAADQKYPAAYLYLLFICGTGIKDEKKMAIFNQKISENFDWFKEQAKTGTALAQFNLGCLYHYGFVVGRNGIMAARLYKLAADQGLAVAQFYLGNSYEFGEGVKQGYSEAFRYYTLAADQGLNFAQNNLSILFNDIYEKGREYENKKYFVDAFRLYKFLVDQGLDIAQKNLSIMSDEIYEEGEKYECKAWKHDVDYYFYEAFRLYKLAADLGHMSAKERLTGERFTDPLLRNALMYAVKVNNSDVVKSLLEFKDIDIYLLEECRKNALDKNYTEIQDLISEAKLVRYINEIQTAINDGKEIDGLWGTPKPQKLAAAKAFLEFCRNNAQGDISQHIAALTEEGTFTKSNLFEIVLGFSEHYTSAVLKQKAELEFKTKEPNYTPSFWDNFNGTGSAPKNAELEEKENPYYSL